MLRPLIHVCLGSIKFMCNSYTMSDIKVSEMMIYFVNQLIIVSQRRLLMKIFLKVIVNNFQFRKCPLMNVMYMYTYLF